MIELPEEFLKTLPFAAAVNNQLIEALNGEPIISVRKNPFKQNDAVELVDKVAWCSLGTYLAVRPEFIADPLFHAGTYYSQEASSMFIEQYFNQLDLENNVVLDLCAASGGKSTHINSLIPQSALLVANEVIKSRTWILKENLDKWGSSNVIVTNNQPKDFEQYMGLFDVVLVDAPCSGEGMFRKDHKARTEWSTKNVETCEIRQKNILENILPTIKDGGVLLYSTCTFNDKENRENLAWLQNNYNVEPVNVPAENIPAEAVLIKERDLEGYQFLPGKTKGEGFFIVGLRVFGGRNKLKMPKRIKKLRLDELPDNGYFKNNSSVVFKNYLIKEHAHRFPAQFEDIVRCVIWDLNPLKVGCAIGQVLDPKGKQKIKYSHEMAFSHELNLDAFESVKLSREDAQKYLQRKEISFTPDIKDWGLVTFENQPLGWIKKVGNRANNYYPKEFRIRKSL